MVLEWIILSWTAQGGTPESRDAGGPVVLPILGCRDCQEDFKPFCIVSGLFLYFLFY